MKSNKWKNYYKSHKFKRLMMFICPWYKRQTMKKLIKAIEEMEFDNRFIDCG